MEVLWDDDDGEEEEEEEDEEMDVDDGDDEEIELIDLADSPEKVVLPSPTKPKPKVKRLYPQLYKAMTEYRNAGDDDEDPNDPVVNEIPVYLNQDLKDQLYLLQFPTKPSGAPSFTEWNVLEGRIKPMAGKIQLTAELDPTSEFYDESQGANLMADAKPTTDGDIDDASDAKPRLERHTLETTTVDRMGKNQNYAIGVICGDAFHITPLKSILQMKTTLPYLDKQEEASAHDISADSKAETDASESEGEDAGKIQVKFDHSNEQAQAEKSKSSKKRISFREKEDQEPWVHLDYTGFNEEVWQQLQTNDVEGDGEVGEGASDNEVDPEDYTNIVFPKIAPRHSRVPPPPTVVMTFDVSPSKSANSSSPTK